MEDKNKKSNAQSCKEWREKQNESNPDFKVKGIKFNEIKNEYEK
jgi:hypothetical protein